MFKYSVVGLRNESVDGGVVTVTGRDGVHFVTIRTLTRWTLNLAHLLVILGQELNERWRCIVLTPWRAIMSIQILTVAQEHCIDDHLIDGQHAVGNPKSKQRHQYYGNSPVMDRRISLNTKQEKIVLHFKSNHKQLTLIKNTPTSAVRTATINLPRNRMKSPIELMAATLRALDMSDWNASRAPVQKSTFSMATTV